MREDLRSLSGMRRMPIPDAPRVREYGTSYVKHPHDIRLFPALVRDTAVVTADSLLEEGQSTCFFHPKLPATALCDVSGRMICDLCRTDWEGRTVSFEALQGLLGKDGSVKKQQARIKWDDVAISLCILPLLFWLVTIVTAPIALGICLVQWRKGPTSLVRTSRWRYVVAATLSLIQIGFWVLFLIGAITGGVF